VTATEIRFGLAVIGTVHPNKVITNSKGKPGDILLLTKPLGIGILSQAMKNNLLDDELVTILLGELCTLNDKVAHMMQQEAIECATDVTGFGLAGHLHKLARSSNCGAEIILNEVPILPKAVEFAADDVHSGIIRRNKEFLRDFLVEMNKDSPKSKVLFDPQTSGGILMAVPENKLVEVRKALVHSETKNWIIGRLTTESPGTIKVI
jgi:selenide,water dikinase